MIIPTNVAAFYGLIQQMTVDDMLAIEELTKKPMLVKTTPEGITIPHKEFNSERVQNGVSNLYGNRWGWARIDAGQHAIVLHPQVLKLATQCVGTKYWKLVKVNKISRT